MWSVPALIWIWIWFGFGPDLVWLRSWSDLVWLWSWSGSGPDLIWSGSGPDLIWSGSGPDLAVIWAVCDCLNTPIRVLIQLGSVSSTPIRVLIQLGSVFSTPIRVLIQHGVCLWHPYPGLNPCMVIGSLPIQSLVDSSKLWEESIDFKLQLFGWSKSVRGEKKFLFVLLCEVHFSLTR